MTNHVFETSFEYEMRMPGVWLEYFARAACYKEKKAYEKFIESLARDLEGDNKCDTQ